MARRPPHKSNYDTIRSMCHTLIVIYIQLELKLNDSLLLVRLDEKCNLMNLMMVSRWFNNNVIILLRFSGTLKYGIAVRTESIRRCKTLKMSNIEHCQIECVFKIWIWNKTDQIIEYAWYLRVYIVCIPIRNGSNSTTNSPSISNLFNRTTNTKLNLSMRI